jgi:hypothetical protein
VVGVVGEQMDSLRCVGRVGRRRAEIAGRFAAQAGTNCIIIQQLLSNKVGTGNRTSTIHESVCRLGTQAEQVLLAITVLCSEPDVVEDAKESHLERLIRRLRSFLK